MEHVDSRVEEFFNEVSSYSELCYRVTIVLYISLIVSF